MYSTIPNKTTFPRYFDYSSRSSDPLDEIDIAASLSQTHYRTYSVPRENQEHHVNHTRAGSSLSHDDFYIRGTDTDELAEFLRTSSPADFQKFLKKSSSEEQLFSFGATYKKSFQFLRATASKSKLKPSAPLPNTVLPKKTSRGKPYLQIQVDYDKSNYQTGLQSPDLEDNNRFNVYRISDFSAGFRDSLMGSSTVNSPPLSSTEDAMILSPAPWASSSSTKTIDAEIVNTYRRFIISQQDPETSSTAESASVVPIEAVGGDSIKRPGYQKSRDEENPGNSYRRRSDPPCYLSSPQNTTPVKVRKRSSSLRRASRSSYSSRSSVYSIGADGEIDRESVQLQRKHSRRAPPRPGPPPARSLPALPESRGSASATAAPISVRDSIRSTASVPCPQFQYIDENEKLQQERMAREERVRARKARDMQQLRLRRTTSVSQELSSSSSSDPPSAVPDSPVIAQSRRKSRSKSRPRTSATTHRSSSLHVEPRNLQRLSMPSMMLQTSSAESSSKNIHSVSHSEMESAEVMQARLEAIERKNKMLEKALIAVIRGTVGQDKRQTDLQRANSLEEILRQLKMVDTGPSSTIVPTDNA
ncbi:hypothetical protein FN846DRAFT_143314 [Sphaerosporella brunnea]|uniref:Uncharacterized protein n=1 Tax=Sphaerosporella brunnea TaxID=1250544 RepID=A0A5J5EQF4_9PEZI|nr:hypothetical protein FN846DRAFT_143314 [Sphaerosporella brunnea]